MNKIFVNIQQKYVEKNTHSSLKTNRMIMQTNNKTNNGQTYTHIKKQCLTGCQEPRETLLIDLLKEELY